MRRIGVIVLLLGLAISTSFASDIDPFEGVRRPGDVNKPVPDYTRLVRESVCDFKFDPDIEAKLRGNSTLSEKFKIESQIERQRMIKTESERRGVATEIVMQEQKQDCIKREEERAIEFAKTEARNDLVLNVMLAVVGVIFFSTVVVLYRTRRRIISLLSAWWWRRTLAFRGWAFATICWACAVFIFFYLFDPHSAGGWSELDADQQFQIFYVMFFPPFLLGALWFGARRFVWGRSHSS